jgi:phosphoglycerate kinase
MKTLTDIPNLKGVKVLLRADFNVPIKNGAVTDDFRIKAALPTIEFLRSRGARLIIASHIEVLEGEKATLAPVADVLKTLGVDVTFITDHTKMGAAARALTDGQCLLLENLRTWEGEKKNDPVFAQRLAALADIYVNDAFPVSHREHASIVGVPKLITGYAGLQVQKEIEHLSKAFKPSHPFLFILGGAKFETKMPLIEKFSGLADAMFIGGAIANDFYKAKGYEVGTSALSHGDFDVKPLLSNPKIILPIDVVNQDHVTKAANAAAPTDNILDVGPASIQALAEKITAAKFILWNGTLGYCEVGFPEATNTLARMIADATAKGTTSIVGGGDTVAALGEIGLEDAFSFVSTAGGAMLDFLAKGTLPGIEALK